MAETLETFVARLQRDGVESGRQEASRLVADAQREAERIGAEARLEAERIGEEARRRSERDRARAQDELRLAARDVALKLQRVLTDALRAALAQGVEKPLADPDFLRPLLRDLVLAYARADASRQLTIEINLQAEMREKLTDWALRELRHVRNEVGEPVEIDLEGTLRRAGFEYSVRGATVEVTVDSVVERLTELLAPELRELFGKTSLDTPA